MKNEKLNAPNGMLCEERMKKKDRNECVLQLLHQSTLHIFLIEFVVCAMFFLLIVGYYTQLNELIINLT